MDITEMTTIYDDSLNEKQAQVALDLLRTAAKARDRDVTVSPMCAAVVLAVTYLGAANDAKKLIDSALFPGLSGDEVHGFFSALMDGVNQAKHGGYQRLAAFVDQLATHHRSELLAVDFTKQATAIAAQVNDWVAGVTRGEIRNLITPGALSADACLVLVNAIYFKGDWVRPFKPSDTCPQPFYTADGRKKTVQMMCQYEWFRFAEHADCLVLGVPFKDDSDDMFIYFILPKERRGLTELGRGLATLEKKSPLTGERLLRLINDTASRPVLVKLPSFKLRKEGAPLLLGALGTKDMFIPLAGDLPFYVSPVFHMAFTEVGEKGSGATAASEMTSTFTADHPFLFAITDGKRLFFVGRVCD